MGWILALAVAATAFAACTRTNEPQQQVEAGMLPLPDGGPPVSVPMDAGPESDADAAICTLSPVPDGCEIANPFCQWKTARELIPECKDLSRNRYYEVRCGEYYGLVSEGMASRATFFYDRDGKYVGRNAEGSGDNGCDAYDPSFRLQACETVTPDCPEPEPVCDCEAEEVSLDCYCSSFACPSFEEARSGACDATRPSSDQVVRGCGYTWVRRLYGFGFEVSMYQGPENTPVGFWYADDVPRGECDRAEYRTPLVDTECESLCSVCGAPQFDGGMAVLPPCEP